MIKILYLTLDRPDLSGARVTKLKVQYLVVTCYFKVIVITMPPFLKKRGRPKVHELTVGLPTKKSKTREKPKIQSF